MGSFLSQIKDKDIEADSSLLNCSHSKLIQYYSSYKSICEGYSINITQYTHIFGPNKLAFQMWDTKSKGKIDAIQMFTGLIIFSNVKYHQKLKFLFQIFDFNQQGFLYYQNLALMLFNICNSTYKILSIDKSVNNNQISQFLNQYFVEQSQIQLQQLLRWTMRIQLIGEYFNIIGKDISQTPIIKRIANYSLQQYEQNTKKIKKIYYGDQQINIDNNFFDQMKNMFQKGTIQKKQKYNWKIEWTFGINVGKQNIKHMFLPYKKAGSQKIFYNIGKIIVIFYPKLNIQEHYNQHNSQVSVIQISKFNKIIASAQNCQNPQIHLWDVQTKLTLTKFKNYHKFGLKFMKFINNDRQLVTISQKNILNNNNYQTAIVIFNIQTKQIIISTYVDFQIMQIRVKKVKQNKQTEFIIIGQNMISFFKQQNQSYNILTKKINQVKQIDKVLSFQYLPNGQIITIHKDRRFYRWQGEKIKQRYEYLMKKQQQIIKTTILQENKIIIMNLFDIQIIKITQFGIQVVNQIKLKQTDLFNVKLSNLIVIDAHTIIVISQFGDCIKISNIQNSAFTCYKYYQIFTINRLHCVKLTIQKNIIIFSQNFGYIVDKFQKQLNTLTKYDFQILQLTQHKQSMVGLCKKQQNKYTLVHLSPIDLKIKQQYKISSLCCIILNDTFLLAVGNQYIYIFQKLNDKYFQKQPYHHKTIIKYPIMIRKFSSDNNLFLIFTNNKQIYKLHVMGLNQININKIQKITQQKTNQLCGLYSDQDNVYPFAININHNYIALSNKKGQILSWQTFQQFQQSYNQHSTISLHSSKLISLQIYDKQMISVGSQDNLIILYKHQNYIQKQQGQYYQADQEQKHSQTSQQNTDYIKKDRKSISKFNNNNKKQKKRNEYQLKCSQIIIQSISDPEQNLIKQIISKIIRNQRKSSKQNEYLQSNNNLLININTIYGLSILPKSLFYFHNYTYDKQSHINEKYLTQDTYMQNNYNQKLQFNKKVLRPIDQIHSNCRRQFAYLADKYCILRSPKQQNIKIYSHHKNVITCFAIDQHRRMIASCQQNIPFAIIRVWQAQSLITQHIIQSKHNKKISRIQFSKDGQWLLTIGGNNNESFSIINWKNQQILNNKYIHNYVIKDILFNPYNRCQISLVGQKTILVYKYLAGQLLLQDQFQTQQHFITAVYTSSIFGGNIESDLITGNNKGDIGLFICGKYILSKQKAHQKGITCLRLTQLFGYKRVLISGGEQGIINIWDVKFNKLNQKNIGDILKTLKVKGQNINIFSIISIDVYQCQRYQGGDQEPTVLAILCSNGDVFEAKIHNQFQGNQVKSLVTYQTQNLQQKINFNIDLIFSAPQNNKNCKFQIFNKYLLFYFNFSRCVTIWSTQFNQKLFTIYLNQNPSVVQIMNTKPYFVAGSGQKTFNFLSLYQIVLQKKSKNIQQIKTISDISVPKYFGKPTLISFSQKDLKMCVFCKSIDGNSILIFQKIQNSQAFQMKRNFQQKQTVFFLQFSISSQILLMGIIKYEETQDHHNTSFVLFDYNNFEINKLHYNFNRFDFSSKIHAHYYISPIGNNQQDKYKNNTKITINAMALYDKWLILGSNLGELIFVPFNFFLQKQKSNHISKIIIASPNPILNMQIQQNKLFISCQNSSNVIVFDLLIEQNWNLKTPLKYNYIQINNSQYLQDHVKNIYCKRKKIQNQQEIINQSQNQEIQLKLTAIIGRNANNKRNNMFVDLKDNIIFYSGCNLIIVRYNIYDKIKQNIIKPDLTPKSIHPQISNITLSHCKRILLLGTSEQQSKIIVWDISTNTYLFQIILHRFVTISVLKISFSGKYVAVLAVTRNAQKQLLLIDLMKKIILASINLRDSVETILDICFVKDRDDIILGCGVNYMGQWQYLNGILHPKKYSLGNNQDMSDIKKNGIIFYSIIFLNQIAITSGSDGYLYIWKDKKLQKRQNAHPGHAVLCLYSGDDSKIFVSGGSNGKAVIWKIWSSLIIQHQGQYPKQGQLKFAIQSIQSVCMTKQALIIGDLSGAVIAFPFVNKNDISHKYILAPFDHQRVNSCAFNTSSKRLFVITQASQDSPFLGNFAIFDTFTFEKLRQQKIVYQKLFQSKFQQKNIQNNPVKPLLKKVIICKFSTRVFIILNNAIVGYTLQFEGKQQRSKLLRHRWTLKRQSGIKKATISIRQNYLAILIAPSPLQNAKIQIFNLDRPDNTTNFFLLQTSEQNIPASIDLIDFCKDHDYLVYQGPDEEQTIIDLMSKQKIKSHSIQTVLQWNEEAKITSPLISDLSAVYSQQNKLLQLAQITNKYLIATDQIGSIRLYSFPINTKSTPSKIYIQHLNNVYLCIISPDSKILVTVGSQDKAIHFWDINVNNNLGLPYKVQ